MAGGFLAGGGTLTGGLAATGVVLFTVASATAVGGVPGASFTP